MNIHDLRLRNKSTHTCAWTCYFEEKKEEYAVCTHARCIAHTTKFTCNEWRPPTAIQLPVVALVIDPEQLRWLEVSLNYTRNQR